MASKALLLSIVISSVLCDGVELIPSYIFCVRFVSKVVLGWCGLYPCCVSE